MSTLRWSLRRELWENRSIYLAPLGVAAFVLFGFVVSTVGLPQRRRALLSLDPAQQQAIIARPFDAAAMILIATAFIVAVFYCLDALHGERRDRSILFWKSLPVSDRTTVMAKAIVPLAILPLLTFVLIIVTQFAMLLFSTAILLPSGLAATTWTRWPFVTHSLILLYGLITMTLWYAPLHGWLLAVSAWARRAPFLWAVLPVVALSTIPPFRTLLRERFIGFVAAAFSNPNGNINSLTELTPGHFLIAPGLWIGLLFAALFLTAAVRLRRSREAL